MHFSFDKNKIIPSIGSKCHVTYTDQKIIKRFIASNYVRRLSSSLGWHANIPILLSDLYTEADSTLSFSTESGVCFNDNTGSSICIYKGIDYVGIDIYVHVFTYCKHASENLAYQLNKSEASIIFEKVVDKYINLCYTHLVKRIRG